MQISQKMQNLILIILYMGIYFEKIFSVELIGGKEGTSGLQVLQEELRSGELIDSGSVGEWRIPEFTQESDGKCKNVVLLSVLIEEELIRTQFWRSCRRGKKKKIRYSDSARCEESPMSVRKIFREYYANKN